MAPVHFQPPIGPSVEPPRTCSPSNPIQAPSKRSSVQWKRSAFPVNCCGAQHSPVVRPHSLSTAIYGPFRVLSTCTCRAQGCCFRRWRGRPFWWASQCSACWHPPPRSSPCGPWLPSLRPCPDCCVPGPPHVILCMQAVRIKSFQAAEWPADLAPVCFNCWQSTDCRAKLKLMGESTEQCFFSGAICPNLGLSIYVTFRQIY